MELPPSEECGYRLWVCDDWHTEYSDGPNGPLEFIDYQWDDKNYVNGLKERHGGTVIRATTTYEVVE